VVWRIDQVEHRRTAGADVFDLSCANA